MGEESFPFAIIVYESQDPMLWVPRGDPDAPPWERCLAYFLRQLYERSRSEKSVRDYRRTLVTFFTSSAHGGPPKHPEHYTREDVEDFLHRTLLSPRNRGAAPSTATMNSTSGHPLLVLQVCRHVHCSRPRRSPAAAPANAQPDVGTAAQPP